MRISNVSVASPTSSRSIASQGGHADGLATDTKTAQVSENEPASDDSTAVRYTSRTGDVLEISSHA